MDAPESLLRGGLRLEKGGIGMLLPEAVRRCIDTLETAGWATYAVGGCVRDSLLGLTPQDYDLCTAATPEQIRQVFSGCRLVLAGEKHGTIAVITQEGPVEITTFRTEGGYRDSRHPDWVRFVSNVEEDLARRDFTINAMAYSPIRGFADPFGGRADLEKRILRAVGNPEERFREDALRILRGVRFSARFSLTPEPETEQAMVSLSPLLDKLARERVFDELCKILLSADAEILLRFAPVLAQAIPELAPTVGFNQHSPHHAYDLFTHIAYVTEAVPKTLPLRWAALLHDIGKPATFTLDGDGRGHFLGHAQVGAEVGSEILLRLKAPAALRERVTLLIAQHMTPLEPDKKQLRRRLGKYGFQTVAELLALQRADFGSKGTGIAEESDVFLRISGLLQEIASEETCLSLKDLAVNGRDLLEAGFSPGPELGSCLEALLIEVQEERLSNTRQALLEAAKNYLSDHSENP